MDNQLTATCTNGSFEGLHGERVEEWNVSYSLVGSPLSFRHSVSLPLHEKALALRLCRAIEAGVVVKDIEVRRDIHGVEYLASTFGVFMKDAHADLKRLGF